VPEGNTAKTVRTSQRQDTVELISQQSKQKPSGRRTLATTPKHFRITLHRLLKVRGEELFQQIAHYGVSPPGDTYGGKPLGKPARVFNLAYGLVGLVCRLGKPVVFNKMEGSGDRWAELWKQLGVYGNNEGVPQGFVRSMLACPLFAAPDPARKASGDQVLAVLFMDSAIPDFFQADVLDIVFNACYGFVHNLDTLSDNIVRFASRDHQRYIVPSAPPATDALILKDFNTIIRTSDTLTPKFDRERATFKHINSFDTYIINKDILSSNMVDPAGKKG
jgi:hypothetical protein